MTGKVRSFKPERHFGFIAGQGGGDYFFHQMEVVNGQVLAPYTPVEFELGEFNGRTCAKNVRPVKKPVAVPEGGQS